jgi:RNA polymerase sigma factor (sigma-70 family)
MTARAITAERNCVWQTDRDRDLSNVGTPMTESAAELVRLAAEGDQKAWNALVARYTNLLWSVARAHRLDTAAAADVVQTTWLRLVEHLDKIQDPERLAGWLATTARRECLRGLRHTDRERAVDDTALDRVDELAEPVDARLLAEERDALLWTAFSRLAERCQQLLRVLMASPPPSYEDVSAALDMPVGSIGPTRGRCLDRLRDLARDAGLVVQEEVRP